jgi:hypothetical protein
MARPVTCGKCGASLSLADGRAERYDPVDRVIVGFLDCPTCDAAYVYIRRDDGSTAPSVHRAGLSGARRPRPV